MYLLTKWHMFTLISLINQPTISFKLNVTASPFLGPSDLSWMNLFLCIWRQLLLVAIIVAAPGKYGFYRNKTWQSQRVCTSELCHCKPLAGDNLRVKVIFRGSVLLRPVLRGSAALRTGAEVSRGSFYLCFHWSLRWSWQAVCMTFE